MIRELNLIREKEHSCHSSRGRLTLVPIVQLPTELLVEIFKFVLDPGFLDSTFYSKSSARAALRNVLCLSQVSAYWRQIVQNAPSLWAIGNFFEIYVDRESKDQYLDGLEAVLARSNPLPVSIALIQHGEDSSYHKTITRVVTPTAHRWKRLTIEMFSFVSFNKIPPETFEALEHLFICGLDEQMYPVVAFETSPRLLHFTFETYSEPSKIHLLRLPWSQIVRLEITDSSLSGCRAILLQCSQLVSGEFTTSDMWTSASTAGGSAVVTLPFLSKLTLNLRRYARRSQIHSVAAFFAPLALPSLTTLNVDFENGEVASWPTQAVTLFQGRCPNIEHIELYGSTIASEGLIALLRNGRALTTLDVTYCLHCIDEHFWRALRYHAADPFPLAPKLKTLRLECMGEDFTADSVEAAIRSRWWIDDSVSAGSRIARLESVSIRCFGEIASDDNMGVSCEDLEDRVQDMVDQGFIFELR
ncbi:hypothetical protein C8R45DRAFT_1172140 [Mycena sanguinolenta]|nr:hypothetical protein C8R45DRAFT_1172140 [Mycena sanguinolenta]